MAGVWLVLQRVVGPFLGLVAGCVERRVLGGWFGFKHAVGCLRHQTPCPSLWWGAVGFLLFGFFIVDASIARTGSPLFVGGLVFVWVLFFVVCVFVVFVECLCLASCEGHMVDALASRADEGRWSLR